MSLTLVVIERDAKVDSSDRVPAPDVLVLAEFGSESPDAFAERLTSAIERVSAEQAITGAKYFIGHVHGGPQLDCRSRIMRALLSAAAPEVNVTLIAHRTSFDTQIRAIFTSRFGEERARRRYVGRIATSTPLGPRLVSVRDLAAGTRVALNALGERY